MALRVVAVMVKGDRLSIVALEIKLGEFRMSKGDRGERLKDSLHQGYCICNRFYFCVPGPS